MAQEIEQVLARNQELTRSLEDRVREATRRVVELQKQVNQLQQLTAMGYLTATLAHDLGTPLHSIAGLASLLQERGDWPPDVARKLELIVQQTQRLNTVIQNVRRATRPPEPHFETVMVPELLNETLSLVEPLMRKAGIELQVDFDEQIAGNPCGPLPRPDRPVQPDPERHGGDADGGPDHGFRPEPIRTGGRCPSRSRTPAAASRRS